MRSRVLGIVAVVLLLVAVAAYTGFWFVAAGRIESEAGKAPETLRAQNLDLSWRTLRVGGFPLALRVELSEARLKDLGGGNGEVRFPTVSASARPWNFRLWRLEVPDGLTAVAGPVQAPVATVTAQSAGGDIAVPAEGGATISLSLNEPALAAILRLTAQKLDLTVKLPPHPPQTHTEPAYSVTADLQGLTLPLVPAPLRNTVDQVSLGATVMGAIPPGPPRRAADAWRSAGGTLELERIALRWGALAISGSGTLALDTDLQPIGALSGSIEGADELMNALVAAGRMRPNDARMAHMALTVLAKPGPNGRPQIATSLTIQNGAMFLGPVKLGPAPRIPW